MTCSRRRARRCAAAGTPQRGRRGRGDRRGLGLDRHRRMSGQVNVAAVGGPARRPLRRRRPPPRRAPERRASRARSSCRTRRGSAPTATPTLADVSGAASSTMVASLAVDRAPAASPRSAHRLGRVSHQGRRRGDRHRGRRVIRGARASRVRQRDGPVRSLGRSSSERSGRACASFTASRRTRVRFRSARWRARPRRRPQAPRRSLFCRCLLACRLPLRSDFSH